MMTTIRLLCLVLVCFSARGADWYSSPTATGGDGSAGNPWAFSIALTNKAIDGGDNLYLTAGTFRGNFTSTLRSTTASRITVQPVAGARVIIKDGVFGDLRTTMPATAPDIDVVIANSTDWQTGPSIIIGKENLLLYTRSSPTNWKVARGWNGTTITTHAIGDRAIIKSPLISHTGTNVTWFGLELTSVQSTNRSLTNGDWYVSQGIDMPQPGAGNSVINCLFYNTGHPAIGWWDQGAGSEINGNVMWGTGFYDLSGGVEFIRGTGLYAQNHTNNVFVKNNLSFRNFTEGLQAYGTTAATRGFRFINNITMMNPNTFGIAVWNATIPTTDNAVWTNYHGIDGEIFGYTSVSNTLSDCIGNIFVAPPSTFYKSHISGTVTNNLFLFDGNTYGGAANSGLLSLEYPAYALTNMSWVWNNNTYYYTNQDDFIMSLVTTDYPAGSGKRKFTNWVAITGFDTTSTAVNGWPNNYSVVKSYPLDYDTNIQHIVVISTSGATNATITPANIAVGETYILRDAQNYFNPIKSEVYVGGTINLPLNLTNVADIPNIHHYTNSHTNVKYPGLFNAFIFTRQSTYGATGVVVAGSARANLTAAPF